MTALIVEDADYKIESLKAFLAGLGIANRIEVAKCFQTALSSLIDLRPQLVLLDMSLPTSQSTAGELEGRDRIYGGRQLLAEMDFEGIETTVVIVTQFDRFGDGTNSMDLSSLVVHLRKQYPKLLAGAVYYSTVDSLWREKLRNILKVNKLIR